MLKCRVGLNPLPWLINGMAFDLSESNLRNTFTEVASTPFRAIHADVPPNMTASQYRDLLSVYGLSPAPGYFTTAFEKEQKTVVIESAKRHAATQAELGNTEVFIAANVDPGRFDRPGVGAGFDRATFDRMVDSLGAAAEAITAEGVTPALHPHVGTGIEVEAEVREVLDAVPASVLSFGPDTGHLTWAGMDPAAVMADYASRIAAVHLKDVHVDQVVRSKQAGSGYFQATTGGSHLWTEPGRGDVDLAATLAALPVTFNGWVIVEVDVPEASSPLASTQISASWISEHLGADRFNPVR